MTIRRSQLFRLLGLSEKVQLSHAKSAERARMSRVVMGISTSMTFTTASTSLLVASIEARFSPSDDLREVHAENPVDRLQLDLATSAYDPHSPSSLQRHPACTSLHRTTEHDIPPSCSHWVLPAYREECYYPPSRAGQAFLESDPGV